MSTKAPAGVEEGSSGVDGSLEVLGETAVSVDPGEGSLDHPSAGMHHEPGLIGELAAYLQRVCTQWARDLPDHIINRRVRFAPLAVDPA